MKNSLDSKIGNILERSVPRSSILVRDLLYAGVFAIPLLPYMGIQLVRAGAPVNACAWWAIIFLLGFMAPIEHRLGMDPSNPDRVPEGAVHGNYYHRILVLLNVPAQIWLLVYGAEIFTQTDELNWVGKMGWVMSNGLCTSIIGQNAAHELIHRGTRLERMAGNFLLATICNNAFNPEHFRGHHVNVATPKDPVTAPFKRSYYRYLPSAFVCTVRDAWRIERNRLERCGYTYWSRHNQLLFCYAFSTTIAMTIFCVWGPAGLFFFIGQSAVAIATLHMVNYIQHYGLLRQSSAGCFEKISAAHAWSSNFLITNAFMFRLPRHADHHLRPGRRYQFLRHRAESPQMPYGYSAMALLALIPPLWFKVMNPRLEAYLAGQTPKKNDGTGPHNGKTLKKETVSEHFTHLAGNV